jgi:hypothetical protein
MASKQTISAICYAMFKITRKWECEGFPKSIPAIMIRPMVYHNVWKKQQALVIDFDEFSFFVEYLEITSQKRVIKEKWNDMIKFGYLKEINESGRFLLNLDLIRPLFGEPNPRPYYTDKDMNIEEEKRAEA